MKKLSKFITGLMLVLAVIILSITAFACTPQTTPQEPPKEPTYYSIIDSTAESHGTLTWCANNEYNKPVLEGSEVVITVYPSSGYKVEYMVVQHGKDMQTIPQATYTLTEISSDIMVYVIYSSINFNVVKNEPENGTLTVSSSTSLGETVTVSAIPDVGYKLKTLKVNGMNVTNLVNNGIYKFTILQDTVIECEFERDVVEVTVNTPSNGTITLSKDTFNYGDTVTVTVIPNEGYKVGVFGVNGKKQTLTDNKYTFTVTENTTITCTFTEIRYLVTTLPTQNGVIRVDNVNPATTDTVTVTFVPAVGYELVTATVNGEIVEVTDNQLVLTNLTHDVEIGATFDYFESTFVGTVEYEDGIKAKGVTVTGGNSTVITDENGSFSMVLSKNVTYSFKVETEGFYSNVVTIKGNDVICTLDKLILRERVVGVTNQAVQSTGLKYVTHEWDNETQSEKITTSINLNGDPIYLRGMLGENGVVFFSVKNITDTTLDKYEKDPGIGVFLKDINSGTYYATHIVGKSTRYVKNGNWNSVPYSGSGSYNIKTTGEKYYFAFVKQGDTVSYYHYKDGEYKFIGAYSDSALADQYYFGFTASTTVSNKNSTVEINDISCSLDIATVNMFTKSSIELPANSGTIYYNEDELYMGRKATVTLVPQDGKTVTSIKVNGAETAFTYTAQDDYKFTINVNSLYMALDVTYGEGEQVSLSGGYVGNHNYDASLYYRNDQDLSGADPGVIYVSEEDDPVYGGWFYMAITGNNTTSTTKAYGAYPLYRSKDLSSWEKVGAVDGCALEISTTDWSMGHYWAPELLQETITVNGQKKNRYYIYFSAQSKVGDATTEYTSKTGTDWDRLYIGVGVSDCPYGPYKMVDTNTYYQFYGDNTTKVNKNGNAVTGKTPAFNFYRYNPEIKQAYTNAGVSADFWPAIDISPFIDPATGDMYCYFSQHSSSVSNGNVIWVVKMKDYITPDYTTMHVVSIPGYSVKTNDFKTYVNKNVNYSTSSDKDKVSRFTYDGNANGSGVNEGAFTIAHYDENTKQWLYYLTYSPFGYTARIYAVCQAVSTSPYGPFTKLDPDKGFVVIGIMNRSSSTSIGNNNIDYSMTYDLSASIDYMSGAGHHSFVKAGNEIYAVYHCFPNPVNNYNANGDFMNRSIAFDRVTFAQSPVLTYNNLDSSSLSASLPVLYGNGASYSLQPLPTVASGYENIASKATVTTTNSNANGKEYLIDGLYVSHTVYKDWEYKTNDSDVITMQFPSAQSIRSVMVYNSAHYSKALKTVRRMTLTLANGKTVTFNNLTQKSDNYNSAKSVMRYGGSIIADFDEVSVTKIEIEVNKADKIDTSSTEICIGDIVVLGRVDGKSASSFEFRSSKDSATDTILVDGKATDKEWKSQNYYYFDHGNYNGKVTAKMGTDGIAVTATIYDKYIMHSDNSGNGTKFEGLNRWYKNTSLRLYAYAGDKSSYDPAKLVNIRYSAYSVQSSYNITGDVKTYGGMNNSYGVTFTIEAFIPYSNFGVNSASEAYLAFAYQRPTTKNQSSSPTYYIGTADFSSVNKFIKVDKNGYVSPYSASLSNGANASAPIGEWKNVTTTYASTSSTYESRLFINKAYDSAFIGESKISSLSMNGVAGYTVKSDNSEKSYALDTNYIKSGKLSRIVLYTVENGHKELVYDDEGKAGDVYLNTTTFKIVKANARIYLFINGKFVYMENDTDLYGKCELALYSNGAITSFEGVSYKNDVVTVSKAISGLYSLAYTSDYKIASEVGFIYTDKLYLFVRTMARVANYKTGAVTVNGEDYSSKMTNGTMLVEYTQKKDAYVEIGAIKLTESAYSVSGDITLDGYPIDGTTVKFVSNSYTYITSADLTYSVSLPSGNYTVYATNKSGAKYTTTLQVATSSVKLNLPFVSKVVGGNTTLGSTTYISSTGFYYSNDGREMITKDTTGLNDALFTGVVTDCAVIKFTSECFLNPDELPQGASYEKDATIAVYIRDGKDEGFVGFNSRHGRVKIKNGNWNDTVKQTVYNVLPKSLSAYGTVQSFIFVYLNDTWYVYFEKEGAYQLAYSYSIEVKGKVSLALYVGTSYKYTRIKLTNIDIETDKAVVESTLASLQN